MSVIKTVLASDPPYLQAAFADLAAGVREMPGRGKKNAHPSILAAFAAAGHDHIVDDEISWCAAKMCQWQSQDGLPMPPIVAERLMGLSWEKMGMAVAPEEAQRGDICTFYYEGRDSWKRHVCYYLGREGNKIWVIGGNQKNAVTVMSWSVNDLAKIRRPVRPTPEDLLAAGSTEIAAINAARKGIVGAAGATGVTAATNAALETPPPPPPPSLQDVAGDVSAGQMIMDGAVAIGAGVVNNLWLVVALLAIGAVYWLTHKWIKRRIERHKMGMPISTQIEVGEVLAG